MLKYRPSQEMDERAITAHLVWLMHRFKQDQDAYPALALSYDAKLAESGYGAESEHGADFALWLRGGGLNLGLRLQAKRLAPRVKSAGSYEHLDHVIESTKARQIDQLMTNTPRNMNSGYIFYNGLESDPGVLVGCCTRATQPLDALGLTLALAEDVTRKLPNSGIADIFPVSRPAHCVVACSWLLPYWHPGYPPIFSDDIAFPLSVLVGREWHSGRGRGLAG